MGLLTSEHEKKPFPFNAESEMIQLEKNESHPMNINYLWLVLELNVSDVLSD